jgi:GntR family transcriptional regulator
VFFSKKSLTALKNKDLSLSLGRLGRGQKANGPKHARLSDCLRQAIADGLLKPGDKLPTEIELVAMTPFSLGTIQRAVRSLVEAGLVQRKPKLGTFVTQSRRRIDEPWHFRFLEQGGTSLLPVYPVAIARRRMRQRGPWSARITGRVIRIDRLVNINDEFYAFSRFFFNGERYPLFEKIPLQSLHGENFRIFLHKQIPEHIQGISHRLGLGPAPSAICRLIGVPLQTICSLVQITVIGITGEALYYQELTVPPSNRVLELADPMLLR